jgi:hypothetical protein
MTYEELDELREMSEEDAAAAEEFAAAVESTFAENSFRNMPRSVRFTGAGFGCMEIFCHGGRYTVVRNNGAGLDRLPEAPRRECFISLISAVYGLRKPEDFAEKEYERLFGEF